MNEQYYRSDGEPCSLEALVRNEPEWACSRLRYYRGLEAAVEKLVEALDRTRRCLSEMQALVHGECPALLDDDRDGDSRLDVETDEALELSRAALDEWRKA